MDKYPPFPIDSNNKHILLLESMLCLYKKIQHILLINLNDIFKQSNLKILKDNTLINDTIKVLERSSFDFNTLLQTNVSEIDKNENLYIKYTNQLDQYVNDPIISEYSNNNNEEDSMEKEHIVKSNSQISTITSSSKQAKSKKTSYKQKKAHEVDKLSRFIQLIGNKEKTEVYLEMGCGKSYLIDNLMINNNDSLYIGIDMKEDLIANSTKQNLTKDNVIVLSSMITVSNFDKFFTDTICSSIKSKNKQLDHILLFGLHSCGNLTSDTLKFFVKYSNFSILAIVGCCLNLLKEYISPEAKQSSNFQSYYQGIGYDRKGNFLEQTLLFDYNEEEVGYPLSKHIIINHKEMFLSRTIRNSSMQKSTESHDINSLSCRKIFYRTLLQAFLEEYIPELSLSYGFKRVELEEKDTFNEYMTKILDNFTQNQNESIIIKVNQIKAAKNEIINAFIVKYTDKEKILWGVYIIRMKFAKLVEYIIALDRAIYLNENGISDVHLIKIFNESVSIRNILIYASKNNNN